MSIVINTTENKNNDKIKLHLEDLVHDFEHKKHDHPKFLFFGHTTKHSRIVDEKNNDFGNDGRKGSEIVGNKSSSKKSNGKSDSAENEKQSCFSRIVQVWSDDESTVRLLSSTLLIITFSAVAAGIFYAIEKDSDNCQWNYWKCLWLVNTIYTTIGYGSLKPCTLGGRAAAVIFAFVGIPLNVWALSDVGKLLTRLIAFVWTRLIRRLWRKCRSKIKFKQKQHKNFIDETSGHHFSSTEIPLTFALFVTFSWFAISACFFTLTERDNMNFSDALYFIMISVTTVGFGDVAPIKYQLVIVQFFFIIIGISLFSMVINIMQDKMDALSENVIRTIGKEYANSQVDGVTGMVMDEKAARDHVKQLIKKQKGGGMLQMVMGKSMQNRLVENYLEKSRKCLVGTQTENKVDDREVMAVPDIRQVSVQVDPLISKLINTRNRYTQLDWMPKIWRDFDWLNLKYPSTDGQKGTGDSIKSKAPRSSSVDKQQKFVRKSYKPPTND